MMLRTMWQVVAAAVLGLALLTLTGAAPASAGCCLCDCGGAPLLCIPGSQDNCDAKCSNDALNSTCLTQGFNATCPQVAECAGAIIPAAAAPLLDQTGLTVVAVLLGGFGIFQAARRARRDGKA
ncbi:MAG: hypothetical protein ABI629_08150 [bacterium]